MKARSPKYAKCGELSCLMFQYSAQPPIKTTSCMLAARLSQDGEYLQPPSKPRASSSTPLAPRLQAPRISLDLMDFSHSLTPMVKQLYGTLPLRYWGHNVLPTDALQKRRNKRPLPRPNCRRRFLAGPARLLSRRASCHRAYFGAQVLPAISFCSRQQQQQRPREPSQLRILPGCQPSAMPRCARYYARDPPKVRASRPRRQTRNRRQRALEARRDAFRTASSGPPSRYGAAARAGAGVAAVGCSLDEPAGTQP